MIRGNLPDSAIESFKMTISENITREPAWSYLVVGRAFAGREGSCERNSEFKVALEIKF